MDEWMNAASNIKRGNDDANDDNTDVTYTATTSVTIT